MYQSTFTSDTRTPFIKLTITKIKQFHENGIELEIIVYNKKKEDFVFLYYYFDVTQ